MYTDNPAFAAMVFVVLLGTAWLGCLARKWKGQTGLFWALLAVWSALVIVNAAADYRDSTFPFSVVDVIIVSFAPAIVLWIVSIPIFRAPVDLPIWRLLLRGLLGACVGFVLTPIVLWSCAA